MKTLPLAAALTLAAWLISSIAQSAIAPPLPGASAPTANQPAPRPLSPTALRESATPPGDLRPEDPVRPQISIPFGKKPALAPEPRAQRRIGSASASAAAGGINDASARCEAEADTQARLACRGKLAQTTGKR
jgi:hypothetical protein